MRHVTWFIGVPLVIVCFGCRIGVDPGKSVVATSQYGVRIGFSFGSLEEYPESWVGRSIRIELLSVTEEGLLVDDGESISLFSYGSYEGVEFLDKSGAKPLEGNPPLPDRLEVARLLSRYPFGLTDDQLASLLADRGQGELIVR